MSDTGRFYVQVGKRRFCVEPIDSNVGKQKLWGDLDPATKKVTGSYGEKNRGSIHPSESIIKEENGFKNIGMTGPGESPFNYIDKLLKEVRHTLTEVVKDNSVRFYSYDLKTGNFTYIVTLSDGTVYSFPIERSDVGNATLFAKEKALTYMRWIRKAMDKGELKEINFNEIEKDCAFSSYRAGYLYYKLLPTDVVKEKEFFIDVTESVEDIVYRYYESYSTLQQDIQQAQSQQGQSEE